MWTEAEFWIHGSTKVKAELRTHCNTSVLTLLAAVKVQLPLKSQGRQAEAVRNARPTLTSSLSLQQRKGGTKTFQHGGQNDFNSLHNAPRCISTESDRTIDYSPLCQRTNNYRSV